MIKWQSVTSWKANTLIQLIINSTVRYVGSKYILYFSICKYSLAATCVYLTCIAYQINVHSLNELEQYRLN